MNEKTLSQAFCLVTELAEKMGVKSIKDLPDVWHCKLNKNWEFAVNGHQETKMFNGVEIPAFHMAVFGFGWLAGLLNPFGGTFAFNSEDDFIKELETKIKSL